MGSDSEVSDGEQVVSQRQRGATEYDDNHIMVRKTRKDANVKGQPKKERTPAQKEATARALAILKERREAKAKEEKERLEKANEQERQRILAEKYEKKKQQRKKLPPAPSYITFADMEKFKNDILGALPKEVYKAVEIPKVVKEKPVPEKVPLPVPVQEKPTVVEKPVKLSGSALLDELFFRNR